MSLLAAVLCLGCTDITLPGTPKLELGGARTVAVFECTASVPAPQVTCRLPGGGGGGGAAGPSRALLGQNQIKLTSSNVKYDTLTLVFGFDATLQNLLSEAIGTPDGTTVTGSKVFYEVAPHATSYNAPYDTGTVAVHNADGTGNFTAANQPYYLYNQILTPQQVSPGKRWEIHVPRSVKTFAFKVRVFTATPSEPKVPAQVPSGFLIPIDSLAKLYAPTRAIRGPRVSGPYPPDVVLVNFHPWATGEERQSALDYVKGRVIGGAWDAYYVLVPPDGTAAPLWPAVDKLLALPQVADAGPDVMAYLTPNSRLPNDGTGWNSVDWQVRALWATGNNWGLEAIEAPLGWGCATGNDASSVAIVDLETQHSQFIESIVSGGTNDNVGLAGLLWGGRVWRMDASRGGTATLITVVSANVAADLDSAFARRAAVINLSWGQDYQDTAAVTGGLKRRIPNASDPNDVARAADLAARLSRYLIGRETMYNHRPLYVIAAGNYRRSGSALRRSCHVHALGLQFYAIRRASDCFQCSGCRCGGEGPTPRSPENKNHVLSDKGV